MGRDARATLAALGPFFALEPDDAPGSWRPLEDLMVGPGLTERVTTTGTALAAIARAAVEPRVVASTASLGLFARLLSPALGATVLGTMAPEPGHLRWQDALGSPLPLSCPVWSAPDVPAVVADVVAPMVRRLGAEHHVSVQVLWGNVASSVVGSLRMVARARPGTSTAASDLAAELLADGPLAGTAASGTPFVRRSCCLYYRVPGAGYCGDCILAHPSR